MALRTITQFAAYCGKHKGTISKDVSRSKLVKSGKWIDDTLEINRQYLMSCGKLAPDPAPAKDPEKSQIDPGDPKPSRISPAAPSVPSAPADTGQYQMNLKKSDADIALKEQRLILMQLEEAKLRGQQIPTELVRDLISNLSKQIINSYKEKADTFLIEISHSTKISDKKSAELKGTMIDMINAAHDKAITAAVKDLEAAIKEQSKGK